MSCITEILKLKGDEPALVPEGNWIAVEGGGVYKDYEYLVTLNHNGHRCGYVALHSDHPYANRETKEEEPDCNYEDLDIGCHGGLTFMSPTHHLKTLLTIPCNDIWIGFDCGHLDDACDVDSIKEYYGEEYLEARKSMFEALSCEGTTVKNFDYVELQCKSIIEQLIKAA